MKHESFRELLALDLYGELDAGDRARLEEHLKTCGDCRRFAGDLESGLGALRHTPADRDAGKLPDDWHERLRRSTIEEAQRRRISSWWSSAAAFAAGILVTMLIVRRIDDKSIDLVARNDATRVPSIYERFNGSTPPPQATSGGQLARLGEYMKR